MPFECTADYAILERDLKFAEQVAYFVVRVVDVHAAGDHTLATISRFSFYAGRYQQLIARREKPSPLSILNRRIRWPLSWLSSRT